MDRWSIVAYSVSYIHVDCTYTHNYIEHTTPIATYNTPFQHLHTTHTTPIPTHPHHFFQKFGSVTSLCWNIFCHRVNAPSGTHVSSTRRSACLNRHENGTSPMYLSKWYLTNGTSLMVPHQYDTYTSVVEVLQQNNHTDGISCSDVIIITQIIRLLTPCRTGL